MAMLFTYTPGFLLCLVIMASSNTPEKLQEEEEEDLAKITWAHAVNSQSMLKEALKSDVDMLEADVSQGRTTSGKDSGLIPIMAHPPNETSDLSLEEFLKTVAEAGHKGVKLDFKSLSAYVDSQDIIKKFNNLFSVKTKNPLWLNADIIQGPVNSTTEPVSAELFLLHAHAHFPKQVLSLGWTTRFGGNITEGEYAEDQIRSMIDALINSKVYGEHEITFAVRAGLAVRSITRMKTLLEVPASTLTLWTGAEDPMEPEKVKKLIGMLGKDRVYVDLPKSVRDKVVGDQPSASTNLPWIVVGSLAILALIIGVVVYVLRLRHRNSLK